MRAGKLGVWVWVSVHVRVRLGCVGCVVGGGGTGGGHPAFPTTESASHQVGKWARGGACSDQTK